VVMIKNFGFLNFVFVCLEERQSTRQELSFNRTNTEGVCIDNLEDTQGDKTLHTFRRKFFEQKTNRKTLVADPNARVRVGGSAFVGYLRSAYEPT
jgi:hypothetical protein